MNKFELVIFDCDGVLVDSERITAKVFAQVLKEECGLTLGLGELLETFMGQSSQQCLYIIEQMMGIKTPPGLEARYQNEISQALKESVTVVNGIEQALEEISIPYCVASGGSHNKMQTTLGKTNLLNQFKGKIFSSSDVKRGKPFPDIFQHAAQSMGCYKPDRCLVIEDSPMGVEGGVAAGMVVFGFADLINEERLIEAGAHHTFNSMSNLVNEITIYEQAVL